LVSNVIDCLGRDFDLACVSLFNEIHRSYSPDLLIGIESGGGYILRRMNFLKLDAVQCAFVRAARSGSKIKKKSRLKSLLKLFPRKVNNVLRLGEHFFREMRYKSEKAANNRNVEISDSERAKIVHGKIICLIDDAVDTGSSLVAVRDAIIAINPTATIVFASIVQTFSQPILAPDLVLYKDVLVRFPWSEDA